MKHTPGPWTLCPINTEYGDETLAVIDADGNFVTDALPRVYAHPELMANALLMAAAPELLAALTGLLSCVGVRIDALTAFDAARAAIAKAAPAPANICERCKTTPGVDPHTCPFREAINGDEETLCNCCADCVSKCSDEV